MINAQNTGQSIIPIVIDSYGGEVYSLLKMIDMIKAHYDIVILISHLDALKDIVDTTITIEKNGSYSYVNI